mmetsp:Transcript_64142/g.101771  ORF Transcript_64142/g.101771 Transcript_64142/m.101771 type:complete len:199 (-) Transcript_64142:230-826(-)|eukprot:CAMPEP_0169117758 /NCGR_PEP_ID=MMETSP1015-20121227/30635_1 /TAXON_ID=342587 /ORGANISM="Karlodinium micrum, Strain CCMP2283" /LENGTH=198 /DNA_ID=CAMNT_0009180475 /DNA_START=37 /DNA_END=633 /DNA_ORIENTATION=+
MASIPFTDIAQGHSSGVDNECTNVIREESKWKEFWNEHTKIYSLGAPDLVDVNFENEMVVCVCVGTKSSGGYSVQVTSVEDRGDDLLVSFVTSSPSGMTTMALTQPHHIIRIARSDKPISFQSVEATPPPRPAKFMLTFKDSVDKDQVMANIKAMDIVINTNMLRGVGIGIVDVSGDISIAKAALEAVEGVQTVEQDG